MGAFAVWGGPALAPAWTEEINARGVICLGCPAIPDPKPNVFPIVQSGEQTRLQLAEYMTKKLKDGNAEFAGDEAMKTQPRVFGQFYLETVGGPQAQDAADFKQQLSEGGIDLVQQIPYTLDPATLQEQAAGSHPEAEGGRRDDGDRDHRPDRAQGVHRGSDEAELLPGVDLRRRHPHRHRRVQPHLRPEAVGARVRDQQPLREGVTRHREAVRPPHAGTSGIWRPPTTATAWSTRSPGCSSPGCKRQARS